MWGGCESLLVILFSDPLLPPCQPLNYCCAQINPRWKSFVLGQSCKQTLETETCKLPVPPAGVGVEGEGVGGAEAESGHRALIGMYEEDLGREQALNSEPLFHVHSREHNVLESPVFSISSSSSA